MPSTTACSFGDVVLVPFSVYRSNRVQEATGRGRKRGRISAAAAGCDLMAVTSQILRPAGALGEALTSDWQGAGLLKASLIKPVLATIEQRLILRKLGALQDADVQALR
jgi:mRNA interferase MazF